MSHLTRGAWIETLTSCGMVPGTWRRTSHEVRGLKPSGRSAGRAPVRSHLTRGAWIETHGNCPKRDIKVSHLTRGAWIETRMAVVLPRCVMSHLTRGAWIETRSSRSRWDRANRRTSHEVRGLKLPDEDHRAHAEMSHLTRGAWIETGRSLEGGHCAPVAPHTRCVD